MTAIDRFALGARLRRERTLHNRCARAVAASELRQYERLLDLCGHDDRRIAAAARIDLANFRTRHGEAKLAAMDALLRDGPAPRLRGAA